MAATTVSAYNMDNTLMSGHKTLLFYAGHYSIAPTHHHPLEETLASHPSIEALLFGGSIAVLQNAHLSIHLKNHLIKAQKLY